MPNKKSHQLTWIKNSRINSKHDKSDRVFKPNFSTVLINAIFSSILTKCPWRPDSTAMQLTQTIQSYSFVTPNIRTAGVHIYFFYIVDHQSLILIGLKDDLFHEDTN